MFFSNLIESLNLLDWKNPVVAVKETAKILPSLNILDLKIELMKYKDKEYLNTVSRSGDKPSHYKWFIYKDLEKGFSIWINEYKKLQDRKPGFATTIHNHRYCFASLILKGSLHQNTHIIEGREGLYFSKAPVTEKIEISKGNSYFVVSDQIHSFSHINDNTVTLFIRSRALKPYSESFDELNHSVRQHYSLSSRISDFRNLLIE